MKVEEKILIKKIKNDLKKISRFRRKNRMNFYLDSQNALNYY